jgi:hypothetical protein
MNRFEYLVVFMDHDRVLTANNHWQGTIARGEDGAHESCPDLVEWLSEAGAQGWEMVALDPEESDTARLFFKRTRTL